MRAGGIEWIRVFTARHGVWVGPSADICCMVDVFAYMRPPLLPDVELADSPPILSDISDVYDVNVDVEGEWDVLDIPPPVRLTSIQVLQTTSA